MSWLRDSVCYLNVLSIILRPIGCPLCRFLLFPFTFSISDIGVNLGVMAYAVVEASGGVIMSYRSVIKRKGGGARAESY